MLEFKTNFEDIKLFDVLGGLRLQHDYEILKEAEVCSRMNVIAGANNTGKSLLLRRLILAELTFDFKGVILEDLLESHKKICEKMPRKILYTGNKEIINEESIRSNTFSYVNELIHNPNVILTEAEVYDGAYIDLEAEGFEFYREYKSTILIFAEKLARKCEEINKCNRIFIPTYRSILKSVSNENWANSIKSYYDINENILINNGHDFYTTIQNQRNSYDFEDIDRVEKFQKLLSDYVFDGNRILIVAPVLNKHQNDAYKNELYLKIGDEVQRPIYEFGEGIQHLIILLWHLLQFKEGIVLIEEPELQLHPGHQRQFIRILKEHPLAQNFIYFITTHSNHILDALNYYNEPYTLFHTKKQDGKLSVSVTSPDDMKQVLDSIGVMNSSVLLANCTIWVEGYSDYIYYNTYLSEYLHHLKDTRIKEGLHYAFLMSSGNNLVHHIFSDNHSAEQSEVQKFKTHEACGVALVILDGDTKDKWSDERIEDEFGINNLIRLKVKEAENTLSEETFHNALKATFTSIISASGHTELKLKTTDFAIFASEKYGIISAKSRKTEIARNAQRHIRFENMTVEAKRIAREIYDFVCEQNSLDKKQEPQQTTLTE